MSYADDEQLVERCTAEVLKLNAPVAEGGDSKQLTHAMARRRALAVLRTVDTLDEFLVGFQAAAARVTEQVATCHERVACPTCRAPIGSRCRRIPAGHACGNVGRLLKHPHEARWTQEVPKR